MADDAAVVLSVDEDPIHIAPLAEDGKAGWADFLARSDNGGLFHDLDFLSYHPPGRFRFHHLVARQGGKLLALIPGGLAGETDRPMFTSPLGASVGGPVIAPRTRTAQGIALVAALQDYALAAGWAGLEMTLAPAMYNQRCRDLLPFSLFARGFQLRHRWDTFAFAMEPGEKDRYRALFRKQRAGEVRAAHRRGVTASEGGIEVLADFLPVFDDTYTLHGTAPTHTAEELADLLTRLPKRISLMIARKDGVPVSGLLVMRLNPRVAYSFYICNSLAHAEERGNLVAFAALLDILGDEGFQWLDTGPGAWDGNFNSGVVFFKESLGAVGHCRDRWRWLTGGSNISP